MSRSSEDSDRENRISMEVIVDCYTQEEEALGWYYYAADNLSFPFQAVRVRAGSEGKPVEVVGMPSEAECAAALLVNIAWEGEIFAVPLSQIQAPDADAKTQQVIADWHYWVNQ